MPSFRDIKLRARRQLHDRMKLAAFYYRNGDTNLDPVLVHVRAHTKYGALGDVKGTSFAYAERNAETPQLVCWREEFEPRRGDVITIENGEGYRVDNTMPPDLVTTTANVVRMAKAEVEDYDFPPGTP